MADDLECRGLADATLIEGVRPLRADALAALMAGYDRVWHW
jgi:sulfur relay (sulfurtransferase) DsrF/TusC family protein